MKPELKRLLKTVRTLDNTFAEFGIDENALTDMVQDFHDALQAYEKVKTVKKKAGPVQLQFKTFDPALDGGIQDECGCDKEMSQECVLSGQDICVCVCHIEYAERWRDQKKELIENLRFMVSGLKDKGDAFKDVTIYLGLLINKFS